MTAEGRDIQYTMSGMTSSRCHPRKWLSLPLRPLAGAGIHPEEGADGYPITTVRHDIITLYPPVIPAVCEPAPAAIGRGGEPSVLLRHPRRWLAGIHPEKGTDGCPITTVGHDIIIPSSPQVVGGEPSGERRRWMPK